VCACLPDELGPGEQEVLIEVVPRAGEDTGGTGAPLETDSTISRAHERTAGSSRPVGQAVRTHRVPGENRCGLAREAIVRLEAEQGKRVSGCAVQRAQAAVVVVLPPEPVVP